MIFLPFDRRINDRVPWVIIVLAGLNVAITIYTYFGFDEVRIAGIFREWGAIPKVVPKPEGGVPLQPSIIGKSNNN